MEGCFQSTRKLSICALQYRRTGRRGIHKGQEVLGGFQRRFGRHVARTTGEAEELSYNKQVRYGFEHKWSFRSYTGRQNEAVGLSEATGHRAAGARQDMGRDDACTCHAQDASA